jgi:hypothetical protein
MKEILIHVIGLAGLGLMFASDWRIAVGVICYVVFLTWQSKKNVRKLCELIKKAYPHVAEGDKIDA